MGPANKTSEDSAEIAQKIRSGEFFRESRNMYDFAVHDPMVERYFYVLITILSALIFLIALVAAQGLQPLKRSVPFIVSTTNITDEQPNIRTLLNYGGEDSGVALLRFLIENYVKLREEYDIDLIDRNANGVKSQSSPDVYQEFARFVDPRNPESPITLYQRHSRRKIEVLSTRILNETSIQVTFEALVESKTEMQKSRWQADIDFSYSGPTIDEEKGMVKPFSFVVAQYKVKRLQDIK